VAVITIVARTVDISLTHVNANKTDPIETSTKAGTMMTVYTFQMTTAWTMTTTEVEAVMRRGNGTNPSKGITTTTVMMVTVMMNIHGIDLNAMGEVIRDKGKTSDTMTMMTIDILIDMMATGSQITINGVARKNGQVSRGKINGNRSSVNNRNRGQNDNVIPSSIMFSNRLQSCSQDTFKLDNPNSSNSNSNSSNRMSSYPMRLSPLSHHSSRARC